MSTLDTTIAKWRLTRRCASVLAAVFAWFSAETALAQELTLSRARVAELVAQAPEARVARAEVEVSRAAVSAAGALSLDEPVLSGLGGMRLNPDGSRTFAGVAGLSWPIDLGGKRSARKDAAVAEQREAEAVAEVRRRRLLLAVLLQHARVLRSERALSLAEARKANSLRVLSSARKRREAGSVPELDVALATLQLGRDAADASSASGEHAADLLRLNSLLGLAPERGSQVSGTLVPEGEPLALDAMQRTIDQRASVREATARVDAAQARAGRESAAGAPTVSVLAQYERDDGANIGMLGVAVPLSVLNANASARATSSAEVEVARARRDAIRAEALAEIGELYARYEATKRARAALLPTTATVAEAVSLATRAYELGEGDLASVLIVHREALDAERALLEAEYAHAAAKLELLVASGRTPQ